ncbi:tRNA lysidine(34) synthetase TilS [Sphingomonas edaphi]|nr:tRNA lysidine(34) synthetase TilS [Sphingomonas edaphi]
MIPAAEAIARFAAGLDALLPADKRLGVAVSGGADSLALLLLAKAARPGRVEAATVDHGFREASRAEAEKVAAICDTLGIPHTILTADWIIPPSANMQAEARAMRYRLLADWAEGRGLSAVAAAHHADDQAETLLMRLARGAGVRGLGGARPRRSLTERVMLVRPLLGWRRADLAAIVEATEMEAVDDPTNRDPRYDRSRFRRVLADADWADPSRLAASAAALRDADEALDWALAPLIETRLMHDEPGVTVDPSGLPRELRRRLLLAGFAMLAAPVPRGPDLVRAMAALEAGETVTLSGLKLQGGDHWRLAHEPPRGR